MVEGERKSIIGNGLKSVECPYCGGRMLNSRKSMIQNTRIYWQKPWGNVLKMDEPILPLACVQCGGVILALRDSARVAREWDALSDEEKNKIIDEQ